MGSTLASLTHSLILTVLIAGVGNPRRRVRLSDSVKS